MLRIDLFIILIFASLVVARASTPDSLATDRGQRAFIDSIVKLEEVVVSHHEKDRVILEPIPMVVADKAYLHRHLSGIWVDALAKIPGVRAMSVGNGFGKPMIRGLGFTRIAYVEGDVKQEGQQWGADHGLEVDAFEDNEVTVVKGPRSLLYGSDALGGVIISALPRIPVEKGFHGEATLLGTTLNRGVGGSLLLGCNLGDSYLRFRYSEQHYGDMYVNTDTINYLSIRIPIHKRRMKNSAGFNRALKGTYILRHGGYHSTWQFSNVYEKVGFFPGAHGIPDLRRLQDDGKRYNIELPFSRVNHLKLYTKQSYTFNDKWIATLSGAYQNNHRSEWSLFHTHYATQEPPTENPDKELELLLHTATLRGELTSYSFSHLVLKLVADYNYQAQSINGYGFLIPSYRKHYGGVGAVGEYRLSKALKLEGGLRYDLGKIDADESTDPYLEEYLQDNDFSPEVIAENRIRSQEIHRRFGSLSGSLGGSYRFRDHHIFGLSSGVGFRFPGINELASNGVHHGSFRHDRGTPDLSAERALQVNASYDLLYPGFELNVSGFYNYFLNYIYATPTGRWSVLPHSGQIFEYRQNKALLFGGEITLKWEFLPSWSYENSMEYVYTYNVDNDTPLPFSPPFRLQQTICFKPEKWELALTHCFIGEANRIVPGEEKTPSANIFDLYAGYNGLLWGVPVNIALNTTNLFNIRYFDHLSFYRKIGLPEDGRSIKMTLKVTF